MTVSPDPNRTEMTDMASDASSPELQAPSPPATDVTNWAAIISVALGVVGFVVAMWVLAPVGALLGLGGYAMGRQGRGFAAMNAGKGGALAITGQVIGGLVIGLWLLYNLAMCAASA